MQKNMKNSLSSLWIGFLALSFLAAGCQTDSPNTPPQPDPKPDPKPTPEEVRLGRYLPPLSFGEQETSLAEWIKTHAAREEVRDVHSITYTLPSDSLPSMRLLFAEGKYREAVQRVKDHNVIKDPAYLQFLEQEGFEPLDERRWVHKSRPTLFVDLRESETMEDIAVYEAYKQVDFKLPYVRFQEEVTRKKLREALAQEGYTYDSELSSTYKQVFHTPSKSFPLMDIYFDRNTERPMQTVLHADSKYAIRSPHVVESLKKENFVEESLSHPLSPILTNGGLGIRCYVSIPSEKSSENGFLSFEVYKDPNEQVEISKIEFPSFDFGKSWQEIADFETGRGNKVTDFMGVLNASTQDPYFVVHGYYFTNDEPKVYKEVVTAVKNNSILSSQKFRQLMEAEGFEFFKEEAGKYTYFHKTLPIIAIANNRELPHSITYRKFP